ncbi:MAG: hypothetical protein IJ480_11090 [Clostridia bacterium]|nr:hypothetical protein [Clostridia bacterium]
MEKRVVTAEKSKGLSVSDLILVAVLLASGAVLKYFVGSIINIGGMKPNFIIAMYCLAIVLVKPKLPEAAVIGLLAGVVCQLFPGTPYLNLISETAGAVVMALLSRIPMQIGKIRLNTAVSAFLATVVSGGLFTVCLFLFTRADISAMAAYVPIVLCTAVFNTVIVQALYMPLRSALHK